MLGTSLLGRLRRRDPGDAILRRAARLTLVASVVFYGCRYGAGSPVLATYGLFGAIAAGAFAQLPGPAPQRARILVMSLPAVWALIAAGSLLAWNTWAAAGGMLVIGFVVAFAGVGNPRLVGLASAFQLFYILASFPPYQPGTVPERLGGVTLAIVLLAAAEVLLWPDPVPVSYRQRLAEAAGGVAAFLDAAADGLTDPQADPGGRDTRRERAYDLVAAIELGRNPPEWAPSAAGAQDRALRICAAALREVFVEADRLAADTPSEPIPDLAAARLLRACAETTRATGRALSPGGPTVELGDLDAAIGRAEVAYPEGEGDGHDAPDVPRLCRDATALALADQARIFAVGVRVATGSPLDGADTYSGLFEYARHSPWRLYWWQFRAHLAPRSAHLHSSVRLAVALAIARVAAGLLQLTHGFWVLLATLTVLRTSAADTRTALRPAVLGTVAGAVVSGGLMLVVDDPIIYAVVLPITLMLAFGVGRLLGPVWQQALFTLLLTGVFTQLNPEGWKLAEARLVDVLLGVVIGVLAGVAMWPRGASHDLRLNATRYLATSADAVEQTIQAVLGGAPPPDRALGRVRQRMILVDSSYCQYHSERHGPHNRQVNWDAVLSAGHRVVPGAESLLRRNPPGCLAGWPAAATLLRDSAGQLRSAYDDLAAEVAHGHASAPVPAPTGCAGELDRIRPLLSEGDARSVRHLVEVDRWLAGLMDSIARIHPPAGGPAGRGGDS
ncbi:FUSC family protein [Micromonospora parathelypteridis]|uniref:Putative membrane protein YccC n=1 Tax=Micromonospora parathelypteridis TaxID=1839617 RepID=A0A840VUP9_9ACTN|nr:FUSC family protein [Micromonospora parathelypteridis]MBB5480435.1 putative membrane protein YccC [Micromonospora parathelypteridis]GGO23381.1 FUSC family protein [Micromonospora parathelypteridis]